MSKLTKLNCIVLIDDDKATNFINKKILTKMGCTDKILIFERAEDAFNYLTNKDDENYIKPDLIFLDINMPKMDGWEFVNKFTGNLKSMLFEIPTIILTSSFNPYDREKAILIPEIKELINKPLNKEIVLEIVERHF